MRASVFERTVPAGEAFDVGPVICLELIEAHAEMRRQSSANDPGRDSK